MSGLQKNVASQNVTFGLISASTGAALTGATVTVYVTKDNGAQATGSGTTTEAGHGQYNYAPTQGETNAGDVGFAFTATSAIPVYYDFHTDIVDGNGYPSVNLVDAAGTAVSLDANNALNVSAKYLAGTALSGRDVGASVLISSGTGTGQLSVAGGIIQASLVQILGTALTETAGQLAAGFKKFFNIASPTSTMNEITLVDTVTTLTGNTAQTGDAYARIGAPAGASVSADIAAVKSDTATILTDVNTGAGAIYTRLGAPAGASVSADIAAVAAKTANLPASPAATGDAMALTTGERGSVADALLDRDMSVGVDSGSSTVRTVRQALRFLRNKWVVAGTALTVFKEDDSTASWAGTVTATTGADPITGNDPS